MKQASDFLGAETERCNEVGDADLAFKVVKQRATKAKAV